MDNEVWKPVPGYEGFYEVSDLGRVKSIGRIIKDRWGKDRFAPERVLVVSYTLAGYGHVLLYRNGVRITRTVHVLVAATFIGPRSDASINHIDGDKRNNRPSNLEYCSVATNNRHALDNRLRVNPRGERHGRSKLSQDQVLEIRSRVASGELQFRVAQNFGVTKQTVCKIVNRQKWQHV
jgi:hypothetical protein